MPYGKYRKTTGRVKRGRRKVGKPYQVQVNSGSKVKSLAGWVPWLLKNGLMLKSLVNTEKKLCDVNTSTTVDSTGFISYISAVAQGSDAFERTGRSIKPLYYHCNCDYQMNASATRTFLRIILFQDSECNAATPAISDVLVNSVVASQYNILTSKGRFKFLMDKLIPFDSSNIAKTDKFTCSVPLKIFYEGTSSAVGSAGKNGLFCLFLSDQATNTPSINVRHRLRFVDN